MGEFAVGTNTACTHVIGNILQDEKIPGIHIAFGHPYAEHTGADWVSKTHIDCVGRDFDIWFDDEKVMKGGGLVRDDPSPYALLGMREVAIARRVLEHCRAAGIGSSRHSEREDCPPSSLSARACRCDAEGQFRPPDSPRRTRQAHRS